MRRVAVGAAGRQPARGRGGIARAAKGWCCPRGEGGGVARRDTSVFSRSVERSETYGLQASPSVVSRQGIINLAPG